jgi:hypothetical protein
LALTLDPPSTEETLVNQPVEISSPEHASNPNSPRVQTSSLQVEISTSPRVQSSPSQAETPVSPGMNPSSPQLEASNPPGTPLASLQIEASALPGTPQTPPQLITKEILLEPEQNFPPIQESRNEVNATPALSFPFNKPSLFQQFLLSKPGYINIKPSIYCG